MARLRLFAILRESAGLDRDVFEVSSVGELLDEARKRYGEEFSAALEFASVAVNGISINQLQGEGTPVTEDDEVALMPPVSGGLG